MNLFQSLGRRRGACDKLNRRPTQRGRLSGVRQPMVPRTTHCDVAASQARRLQASWSLNAVTGTLECRWVVHPSDDLPRKSMRSGRANGVRMHRMRMHRGTRPSPLCAQA